MKITMLKITTIVAGAMFFISCNKDYTCVCKLNGVETNRKSVRAKAKNLAEDECNQMQSSLGVTYECAIE